MQHKYKISIVIIIIIFIFASLHLFANNVRSCSIAPLNRLSVQFDTLPSSVRYKLSDNKKLLTINVGLANFNDDLKTLSAAGIINKVSLNRYNDSTIIEITFAEPRGYTINKQFFSRTLVIEVFDWNKLDTAQDFYRLGLLSLIDNETELAKSDLIRAVNYNVGDAATTLGFILLNEGKINSALNNFKFAEIKGTSLNDNYAAMSQIYNIKNDSVNSIHYANLYKSKTGSTNVPTINITNITESGDVISEKQPYIDSILKTLEPLPVDTAKKDTNKKDTIDIDTTHKEESIWEAENYLLLKYAVGIVIALILLIVYLYLKWRNKQLLVMQQYEKKQSDTQAQKLSTNVSKKKNLQTAVTKPPAFNKLIDDEIKNSNKNINNVASNVVAKSTTQPDYKKNADVLLNMAKQRTNEDNNINNITQINKNAIATYNKNYSTKKSPNIELANRIAEEQKRIKSEKLSKLDSNLNIDAEKLNNIARKLGVEKNTLETKRNIVNLTEDAEQLAELSKKLK